jgi:hypothetical protein
MNRSTFLSLIGVVAVMALGASTVSSRWSQKRMIDELSELRARRDALRDSLRALSDRDSVVRLVQRDSSSVAVALPESLVAAVIRDGVARYLDRFELDLTALRGHGEGLLYRRVPVLGRVKAGEWNVHTTVDRLTIGVTAEPPDIDALGSNRLRIALPIVVHGGRGVVTLHFAWNSKSIFNVVCRDFEASRTIAGAILPQRHVARGDIVLSAGERAVVADPQFPPERFPIAMDLTEASWQQLRDALEEQNTLSKCGLVLEPESVIHQLRATGLRGLRFRLPRALLEPIALPASFDSTVRILNARVQLSVRPHEIRAKQGTLWYSADVGVRRANGGELVQGRGSR